VLTPRDGLDGAPLEIVLFVNGARSPLGERAVEHLSEAVDGSDVRVQVIDVAVNPEAAERARVLATPTLISVRDGHETRLVGDLSDRAAVRRRLGLR
jgi:circadian clock protein KaiB